MKSYSVSRIQTKLNFADGFYNIFQNRILKVKQRNGSVLILAIWVMSLLVFFAVYIGLNIRQKASLLSRIEKKSELRFLAASGIKRAIADLQVDLQRNNVQYTPYGKYFRHNNPEEFKSIELGRGEISLEYEYFADTEFNPEIRYGFVDEESKININLVDRGILKRLIQYVVTSDNDRAQELTDAIVDWREFGRSRAEGFYSDSYYSMLEHPYEPKSGPFELIEELKLIKGMNQTVYDRLTPFITVYGDGLVNINTASRVVLLSLGLNEELVDKILLVRRGFDGLEATIDDYIFLRIFDIAVEMKSFVKMELTDMRVIDDLNAKRLIKTNSFYYKMKAIARLPNTGHQLEAVGIYNVIDNRLQYWSEK